jgi:excinuclease ABC subunit B
VKAIRASLESEVKARRTVQEAVNAVNDTAFDQTEIVRLLEEEMLEAAKNLEFERAAQLRDKINEMQGAPTIRSAAGWSPATDAAEVERQRIWQPKTPARGKRRVAK